MLLNCMSTTVPCAFQKYFCYVNWNYTLNCLVITLLQQKILIDHLNISGLMFQYSEWMYITLIRYFLFLAELFRGMLFKWKGANKKSHQKWDFIVNLVLWLVKQRVTWPFPGDFWRKTTTNHHETTTENHYEPPWTTTNHHKPLWTTMNHYKPPQTTTKSHSKWDLILNLGLWLVK